MSSLSPPQLRTNFRFFSTFSPYIYTFESIDAAILPGHQPSGLQRSQLITPGDPFPDCRLCPRFENSNAAIASKPPPRVLSPRERVASYRQPALYTGRYCPAGVINLSSAEDTLCPYPRWPRRVMIRGTHDNPPPALVRHPCVSYGCPPYHPPPPRLMVGLSSIQEISWPKRRGDTFLLYLGCLSEGRLRNLN